MTKKGNRIRADLALLGVVAIWGFATPIIKVTLSHLAPFTFLYFRFLLILPIVIPIYIWYLRKYKVALKDMLWLTLLGLLGTTMFLGLFFVGLDYTTVIDASLLGSARPIFVAILGALFLHEIITKREFFGYVLVILGTIITVTHPLLNGNTFAFENLAGNVIIFISGMSWALFVFLAKKGSKKYKPLVVTLHGALVAFITFAPLAYIENGLSFPSIQLMLSSQQALLGVVYMAFISYFLAYYLYEYGVSKIEISEGSVFEYLIPLFSAPLAVVFLGETITIAFIVGAILIATGVVLNEWK